MKRWIGLAFLLVTVGSAPHTAATALSPASDCSKTSVGFTPLNDLGQGRYKGFVGGLYGDGQNAPPDDHLALVLQSHTMAVRPRGPDGQPAGDGKVVLLSVGMSNATQEYSAFVELARHTTGLDPDLVLVDGAQGGQTASIIRDPSANYWTVLDQRLTAAGVTKAQVQAIWLKEANANPKDAFPTHAKALQADLEAVVHVAFERFPHLQLIYLASRIYGGYASSTLNPEPYAYESGFAVQWLIDQQLAHDASLNLDPARGPVAAPALLWGPYLWADGLTPRSDGLTWLCEDLVPGDGTHPSTSGRQKVAHMLLDFFSTDPTSRWWFMAPTGAVTPTATVTRAPTATLPAPTPTRSRTPVPERPMYLPWLGAAAESGSR